MIPWLIGAAVVGIAAAIASDDDDNSTAGTIKRVIRNFWDGVVDAFSTAVSKTISTAISVVRTLYEITNGQKQHVNKIYRKNPDGTYDVITKTLRDVNPSDIPPDVKRELDAKEKADVTEKRRELTGTYY